MNVLTQGWKNLGYQQISGLSAATGFTIPTGTSFAVVVPQTQAVRWRDDGSDPTASVGMPLAVGDTLIYDGQLSKIKFIEVTASAVINVSYFGPN